MLAFLRVLPAILVVFLPSVLASVPLPSSDSGATVLRRLTPASESGEQPITLSTRRTARARRHFPFGGLEQPSEKRGGAAVAAASVREPMTERSRKGTVKRAALKRAGLKAKVGGKRMVRSSRFERRAGQLGQPVCEDKATQLSSHDCNVALLALGGGIEGEIQFLRVDSPTNSATSGTCTVTVTTDDGGNIDISKGRLEHGGVGGFDNLLDTCGATPGSILIQGGSTKGGNTLLTITAAA